MPVYKLDHYWYSTNAVARVLLPLAWLFQWVAGARRGLYRLGLLRSYRIERPVIVVGNISVGGSGKTPLVIWLAEVLKNHGYKPGIVSRGYRARTRRFPQRVTAGSDAREVGDEALLLARRTGCPMVIDPRRARAARALADECDVIIADDGLQHYALQRDIEIAVIDGARRHGNGYCLPAGPLREPLHRLTEVDIVVGNGAAQTGEWRMDMRVTCVRNLLDETIIKMVDDFKGAPVHAVAGIGNPARFFNQLRELGLQVVEHAFPDHYDFQARDGVFDSGAVLMTEKDAVKYKRFAQAHHWYVPVHAVVQAGLDERIITLLEARTHG